MVKEFIDLRQVHIHYGHDQSIVSGLDLSLFIGKMQILVGANGAGKSSLLRVAAGLQRPQSGSVFWEGKELAGIKLSDRAKKVGALLRSTNNRFGMSLCEFVCLGRIPHTGIFGKLKLRDIEIAREAAQKTGILEKWNQPIQHLSDGEFRKAQLAQLLTQEVPFLVLDEPTTHLDAPSSAQFMRLLKELTLSGKGVLLTTHDLALAHRFADEMLLLHKGQWLKGSADFVHRHALYADFIGTGEMNDHQKSSL